MADERTDRELMVAVRETVDVRAFEELATRWDKRLVQFLTKLTGDVHAACDLRQETLLRIWRSAATYNEAYAFSTWVTRIASNLARTHARKMARPNGGNGAGLDWESLPGVADPRAVDVVAISEQSITVDLLLDSLPIAEKELLLMRFQLELTYPEIAAALEVPESTAKSRVTSLLRRLRVLLEETGIERSNVTL